MAVAAVMAGCAGANAPGTPHASSASTTIDPTMTGSPIPAEPATSGTPVPVTAGKVDVRTNKTSYRPGEVVHVTVANGSGKPIYTEDFKTDCSIVTLQHLEDGTWKGIEGCILGRPTATITIGDGLGQAIALDPHSVHLRDGGNRIGFGPGTHRIKLSFRLHSGASGEEPLDAYSPDFTIS